MEQKVSQKFPLGLSKKERTNFENLEGGSNETKRKASVWNIEREDTKSHLDVP